MSLSIRGRAEFIKATKGIEFPFPSDELEPADPAKYQTLHERMYRRFMDSFRHGEAAESSGIHHGFMMHAKIIGRASVAYTIWLTGREDTTPDYQLLQEAMLASYSTTIEPIANTDGRRNDTLETELGLTYGDTVHYEFAKPAGTLLYRPDPLKLFFALYEISHREESGDLEPRDPRQHCPALSHVLPSLWDTVVRGCIEDPRFFRYDVEQALDRSARQQSSGKV